MIEKDCLAPDIGDMDFCLQCPHFFYCVLRELALQKANDVFAEV